MVRRSTPVIIPVYFDYASSLCYIAWRITGRLEAELGVVFHWHPVHIAAQYPQRKQGEVIGDEIRANIERVARETGVTLRIPERWLDSRPALEGALFAEERGAFTAYHRGVFTAGYEHGADIGDRRVLVQIAGAAGLPIGSFMESIATRRAGPQLAAVQNEARRRAIVGYPTFLLGEFPLVGIQPYETMKVLIARHIDIAGTDAVRPRG
jgi:predicted DsbA family dithiol-disulfide isomerase